MPSLIAALELFFWAIEQSKIVFFLLFCTVGQAAVFMMFVFHNGYMYDNQDPHLGSNASSFLNAFVAMFAFLTSGDNWAILG